MTHTHHLFVVVALAAGLLVTAFVVADSQPPAQPKAAEKQRGELFHVVSFKFKPGATPEQIGLVEQSFASLKEKILGIQSLKWGTNVSPEKHDNGFTHCFVLTFATEKDRDAYLVHEDHKAFGKVVGPVMQDVFVIDFWAKQ
jgi:hypothetical protein